MRAIFIFVTFLFCAGVSTNAFSCANISGKWAWDHNNPRLKLFTEFTQKGCLEIDRVETEVFPDHTNTFKVHYVADGKFYFQEKFAANDGKIYIRNKNSYFVANAFVQEVELVRESDNRRVELSKFYYEANGATLTNTWIYFPNVDNLDKFHKAITLYTRME